MHALIALTDFPSMPAPLTSTGPGECWVWGDYVLTVQIQPEKMAEVMSQMTGTKLEMPLVIDYPCAITVYYRKDRNPHGPSSRPILVVGLEKMDYTKALPLLKMKGIDPSLIPSGEGPPVLGVFAASGRFNMGDYKGAMDLDSMRSFLFSVVAERVQPAGDPVQIGPLSAIHGHPDTGWPALKKKSGCMSLVLVAFALAAASSVWLLSGGKQAASPAPVLRPASSDLALRMKGLKPL